MRTIINIENFQQIIETGGHGNVDVTVDVRGRKESRIVYYTPSHEEKWSTQLILGQSMSDAIIMLRDVLNNESRPSSRRSIYDK